LTALEALALEALEALAEEADLVVVADLAVADLAEGAAERTFLAGAAALALEFAVLALFCWAEAGEEAQKLRPERTKKNAAITKAGRFPVN
jgi:hypothetical protein